MSSIKILIIEDNEASLKLLDAHLKRAGYTTVTVQNGYDGLKIARQEKPDLIVLDLMLPDIDGHKLCYMIKFDKKLSHIPVAIWTSRDSEDVADLAKNCGADAFVAKTTRIPVVMDIISRLLNK